MLPLLFSPILAFLFLLQYLKTHGEQLLNISQWIKMKRLLREVLLMHSFFFFLFLYCCCFSPTCPHALACVTCCEWKEHLHTWWQCLSSNELHNPPSLQTIFKSAAPLPHTQPLDAAGVWEQSVPSPPLLTYNQIEVDVIIAEAKRLTLFKSKL